MQAKIIRIFVFFGILIGGWFFIENIQVASKNLTAILPAENTVNADNIGVYFWAGQAGESQNDIIQTGSELLQDLGTGNIRITISPKSDIDYKGGGCIANFSLKGLAQRSDFRGIISDPKFKTIMITVNDGVSFPDCFTKNYLNPDFYTVSNTQKIQQEYKDFADHLAAFSGKTFIISNWEGDNDVWCGAAFGATSVSCPNHQRALAGFKKWVSARTAGIRASGARNVFSAVEFNIVRDLKNRGLPSVLYDVIPDVETDYFSYSSYESINSINNGDGGARFRDDVGIIRQALNSAGKQSANLIIGEYGFDQGSREEIKNKLAIASGILLESGIKYSFVWNLLDVGGPFGLYDSSANLVAAGDYFCDLWNGSACGPKLTFTNITESTRNPRFWVIDSWRLQLSGAPANTPIKLCAEQNGQSLGCTPVEDIGFEVEPTTDGSGNWVLENSWTGFNNETLYGTWKEWAEIGDVKSTAVRFRIQGPDLKNPSAFFIPEDERSEGGGAGDRTGQSLALFGSGDSYQRQLDAEGGTEPYSWEIIRGELPAGLNLGPSGLISGELSQKEKGGNVAYALVVGEGFGVRVRDSGNPRRQAAADIEIAAAGDTPGRSGRSGSLVPCGRLPGPGVPEEETRPCQICDTLELIDRVWKFLLTVLVPGVAIVFYIGAGVLILLYGANSSLQATGKNLFKTTTYGVIIIFGAWMLTNTVMRSLAGDSIDRNAPWYVIQCVNPVTPRAPITRKFGCNSLNRCVVTDSGTFINDSDCGGTCAPSTEKFYTCNENDACVEDEEGEFDTLSDCENECGSGPPGPGSGPAPGPGALAIDTASLPDAVSNQNYSQQITVRGGTSPHTFSISAGALPAGLSISNTGTITGRSTIEGNFSFTIRVQDSTSPTRLNATRPLTLRVSRDSVTISGVAHNNITQSGATITWTTDKPSTSQVEYGTTTAFGSSTPINNSPVTTHSVVLTGLTANTTYNYRAKSSVTGFSAVSSANSFTTSTVGTALFVISTTNLPNGTVGQNYLQALQATGGQAPLTWSKTAGNLPAGLNMTSVGSITGTPTTAGDFNFTVRVEDSTTPTKQSVTKQLSIKVNTTTALACVFNGTDYSTFNLCQGQRRSSCGTPVCSQYLPSINRYAGGAASVDVLKTFMVIESDCNIRVGTTSSFGLMQLRPDTANNFLNRCPIQQDEISCRSAGGNWGLNPNVRPPKVECMTTRAWLQNPVNADKSVCLGASFIRSIATGTCGSQPRNIYAGYNAGPGNCARSTDCVSDRSCDGGTVKRWECPYDNPQHTTCNTRMYETKQGATYVNFCLNNLGF